MDNSGGKRLQVLIVDDQPRARHSLKALLTTLPQVGGFHEAETGKQAIAFVEHTTPDLVIMDVRMPEMDGLLAAQHIKTRWPQVKVVLLSMHADYELDAITLGADAFVCKGDPPSKLLATLSSVISSCLS
jgi:DNA-binding NarL/FixJ family response regulator